MLIIDKTKLNKIGIDRLIINGFSISNFEKLEKTKIESKDEVSEKLKIKTHLITLNYEVKIGKDGKIYPVASLEVNPNKFRDGHNAYNSSVQQVKECLQEVCNELEKQGIELDISEAKIKEIEINITYEKKYSELEDVMRVIRRANYKKAFQYMGTLDKNKPKEIDVIRSTYLNSRKNSRNEYTGKTIKIYDKSYELLFEQQVPVDIPLTRVEVLLRRDYWRVKMQNLGLSNSLKDLLKYESVIEDIFHRSMEHELITTTQRYITDELRPNLSKMFLKFKRNEKLKREERKKLIESNKKVPDLYKEERGVFNYLEKESWIFDYTFLYEIVEALVESKHRKSYREQIVKRFKRLDGNFQYMELLGVIFSNDFF